MSFFKLGVLNLSNSVVAGNTASANNSGGTIDAVEGGGGSKFTVGFIGNPKDWSDLTIIDDVMRDSNPHCHAIT